MCVSHFDVLLKMEHNLDVVRFKFSCDHEISFSNLGGSNIIE